MAKFFTLFCLVALLGLTEVASTKVKRAFWDAVIGGISDIGSAILPADSMRTGCASVGLYNREKDGGPPNKSTSSGIVGGFTTGIAKIGNAGFSRQSMEQGCINAGFYDRNLDEQGNPKNPNPQVGGQTIMLGGQQPGGGQSLTLGGPPEPVVTEPPKPRPVKRYRCFVNGVESMCEHS